MFAAPIRPPERPPTIVPWAWERRELLETLPVTEVAYLAGTFRMRGSDLEFRPRMQSLFVPTGTRVDPVFRIETDATTLRAGDFGSAAAEIAGVARNVRAALVQIDFDATTSQRRMYRDLLIAVRRALPRETRISITALASWCMHDGWLDGLPIDEAVPMLFRMGADAQTIRERLQRTGRFPQSRCRGTAGFSTDEPMTRMRDVSRVYVFHPRAWSAEAWRAVEEEIHQWRE